MQRIDYYTRITGKTHVFTPAAGLLLDGFSLGVVYSVRRLVSAYGGDCVRIRRSSDDAEDDFGFVDDELDTASIATFIGGGNGFLVTWYDQSGNGFNQTQATASKQGQYVASGIGSLPSFSFDGNDDDYSAGSINALDVTGSDQGTFFAALRENSTSQPDNQNGVLGFDNIRFNVFGTYEDEMYFDFANSAGGRLGPLTQPGGWSDNPHVLECFREAGGTQAVIVDGSTVGSGSRTGTVSSTPDVFRFACIAGSVQFFGQISEAFILKTDIGSSDRTTVRENLGDYYGISV